VCLVLFDSSIKNLSMAVICGFNQFQAYLKNDLLLLLLILSLEWLEPSRRETEECFSGGDDRDTQWEESATVERRREWTSLL